MHNINSYKKHGQMVLIVSNKFRGFCRFVLKCQKPTAQHFSATKSPQTGDGIHSRIETIHTKRKFSAVFLF